MQIEVGSFVMYNGKEYQVVWIYDNGNVEIVTDGQHRKIELVQEGDLTHIR
ncbi:hypothetical protein ABID52_000648 [Fictibacillus halophilus]|uniref:Uncharacterized protein n=2 Tax=Fictibacillus TaxID=1329200 RepID=A0ABS2ZPG0_9BACL|nr:MULTISPECIES: hypothetical protein [Fictibacillus]MBN3554248.1 hypothetical protein [Fictibacillus nanhaiensis]